MRILWILPGRNNDPLNMPFVQRGVQPLREQGVEIELYFLESRRSIPIFIKSWWQAYQIAHNGNFDYVHAQFGSVVGLFSWLLGLPLIITFRGSDVNGDPFISKFRQIVGPLLSRFVARRAKQVICVSEEIGKKIKTPYIIMPSPIDTLIFRPISKLEARKKLDLPIDDVLIAFAGGSRPLKKRDLALEACRMARVKMLEIKNSQPQDMPWWINAADILILTSEREGSPNIVKEALACGVPVVSVDVGDVAYWLKLDTASRLVASKPLALSNAIQDVLSKSYPRERRIDLHLLSPEAYAKSLKEVYLASNI
jgi:teichuronic acid biosynthesis glycosyltransferase TuaC